MEAEKQQNLGSIGIFTREQAKKQFREPLAMRLFFKGAGTPPPPCRGSSNEMNAPWNTGILFLVAQLQLPCIIVGGGHA